MADLLARMPVIAALHIFGGVIALITGAFQVSRRFRERHRRLHRVVGVVYVGAVVTSGLASLPMAATSLSNSMTRFGFGLLGVCWLATTLLGFAAILNRDVPTHRRWMLRSFAVTLAAVTLRIYLPLSGMLGIPFERAYSVVAWLCWVPNLVVMEIWLRSGPRQRSDAWRFSRS